VTFQYYLGCSAWPYSFWQGPFYLKGIEDSKWLRYYSKIFRALDASRRIIPYLDKRFRYAVEVRHRSWFQDLASISSKTIKCV
jgi:uncharacterized protein YecE (DUF72 family)